MDIGAILFFAFIALVPLCGFLSVYFEKKSDNQQNSNYETNLSKNNMQNRTMEANISSYVTSFILEKYKIELNNEKIQIDDFLFIMLHYELFICYLIHLEFLLQILKRQNLATNLPVTIGKLYCEKMATTYPEHKSCFTDKLFGKVYHSRHNMYFNNVKFRVEKLYGNNNEFKSMLLLLNEYKYFISNQINSYILSYIKYGIYYKNNKIDINELNEFNKICIHKFNLNDFIQPILNIPKQILQNLGL